jgi:hypothetical protein
MVSIATVSIAIVSIAIVRIAIVSIAVASTAIASTAMLTLALALALALTRHAPARGLRPAHLGCRLRRVPALWPPPDPRRLPTLPPRALRSPRAQGKRIPALVLTLTLTLPLTPTRTLLTLTDTPTPTLICVPGLGRPGSGRGPWRLLRAALAAAAAAQDGLPHLWCARPQTLLALRAGTPGLTLTLTLTLP